MLEWKHSYMVVFITHATSQASTSQFSFGLSPALSLTLRSLTSLVSLLD